MKIPVTVQGITVRSRDDRVIEFHMGDKWLGNGTIMPDGATIETFNPGLDKYSDLFPHVALALSVAPEAEWTIRSFSPNDHRYTFGERAYATELEAREAFQRAVMSNEESGGGAELRFNGVKVDRHSSFSRSS